METFILGIVGDYGLAGAGLAGLGWLYLAERKDHKATKREHNEDLKLLLPAIVESTANMRALIDIIRDRRP